MATKTTKTTNLMQEAKDFFQKKKDNTRWVDSLIRENQFVGSSNAPMLIEEVDESHSILKEDGVETPINAELTVARECAGASGTFMTTPVDNKMVTLPVKMCSIAGLLQCLGVSCRVMNTYEETKALEVFDPRTRALFLNKASEIYKYNGLRIALNKTTNEIRAIHGDKYIPMPEIDLLEKLTEKVNDIECLFYKDTDEFTQLGFIVKDSTVVAEVDALFKGTTWEGVKPAITLCTSDCGFDSVTLAPALYHEKGKIIYPYLSDACTTRIKHVGNFTDKMEVFAKACENLYKVFSVSCKELNDLKSVKIKYPISCFKNVASVGLGFSQKDADALAESGKVFPKNAFDLFTNLFALCKAKDGLLAFKEMEKIGMFFNLRLSEFDIADKLIVK